MQVLHVSHSDGEGGAAIAAVRLHRALLDFGIGSRMFVIRKYSDDPLISAPLGDTGAFRVRGAYFATRCGGRLLGYNGKGLRSFNLFPSGLLSHIEQANPDVVHFHWLGKEALSVDEIGRFRKPLVWTLHDMWAICGAEHYDDPAAPGRFRDGYQVCGARWWRAFTDLDRWTYRRKVEHWQIRNFSLICPSRWMADQAAQSTLMQAARTSVIPNAINTGMFKPIGQDAARQQLALPQGKHLVLFGAMDSTRDRRKGFDLLERALARFYERSNAANAVELVVFGADVPATGSSEVAGFPAHFRSRIRDDTVLAALYSAADVFVAPSRQDNLPNTIVEAQSCGTPTIAFDVGGIADIVETGVTGCLVPAFDVAAFAAAMVASLSWNGSIRERCRRHAELHFDAALIASRHADIYRNMLCGSV